MNKLKILYSTIIRSNHIIRYGEFFKWEVEKLPQVHLHFLERGGHIKEILKSLDFCPDFIFFDDFTKNYPLAGLDKINIPKGVLYWDVQKTQSEFRKFVEHNRIDFIFSFYRDAFLYYFPDYAPKFRWLPNHAYTEIHRDYGLEKDIDFLLMGQVCPRIYPLRDRIVREMRGRKNFVYYPHPGYKDFPRNTKGSELVGENYARIINRAKIFFTDDSIYRFPIAKYFEAPAGKALLLAPGSKELEDLGFINGRTFLEINKNNYLDLAFYYLEKERERKAIAQQGYEMVVKHHSTRARAREFFNYLKEGIYGLWNLKS